MAHKETPTQKAAFQRWTNHPAAAADKGKYIHSTSHLSLSW